MISYYIIFYDIILYYISKIVYNMFTNLSDLPNNDSVGSPGHDLVPKNDLGWPGSCPCHEDKATQVVQMGLELLRHD